jgi:hypothetical protein
VTCGGVRGEATARSELEGNNTRELINKKRGAHLARKSSFFGSGGMVSTSVSLSLALGRL